MCCEHVLTTCLSPVQWEVMNINHSLISKITAKQNMSDTVLSHTLRAVLSPVLPLHPERYRFHLPREEAMVLARILHEFFDSPYSVPDTAHWKELLISFWFVCDKDIIPTDLLCDPTIMSALLRALSTSHEMSVIEKYKGDDKAANEMAHLACLFAKQFHRHCEHSATDDDKAVFRSTLWKLTKEYVSPRYKQNILQVNCFFYELCALDGDIDCLAYPDPEILRLLLDYGANRHHRDAYTCLPIQHLNEQFEGHFGDFQTVSPSTSTAIEQCALLLAGNSTDTLLEDLPPRERTPEEIIDMISALDPDQ